MNPLLQDSNLPLEVIDFSKIKEEHFLPALEEGIKMAKENYEAIKKETDISFESIVHQSEIASDRLDQVIEVFYALYSAHCTQKLSDIAEEFNKKLTEYSSDISLDADLFKQYKLLNDKRESLNLTVEQSTVLDKHYKDFVRNGALLNDEDKASLREIDQKISKLNLDFSENVRKANNDYVLVIEDEKNLVGMPEGILEAAKQTAKEKGHEGKWAFTFDFPSYFPFMQYCQNRELRKELYTAYANRATSGDYDNRGIILETLKYRKKRADLLGYKDHPAFVLEERMAKDSKTVLKFIDEIESKAIEKAKTDTQKLKDLKKELTGDDDLRAYDVSFYQEILKKRELDFDDEELRPYFKLENVLDGIFTVANKLYGLNFKERKDLPAYHEDVRVYEVTDDKDNYVGVFYGDYFPRPEKRPGAWMTTFRTGGYQFGEVKRPFVCNVCNFTKPTATKPSLLTLNEVSTLFHEFGHGLHGMLTRVSYRSVAGANVHWDFVELPSQIMENWLLEKECLDLFAKHFETGELIPEELVNKIKASRQFMEGRATIRQLSFAKLDMKWHLADPDTINDVMTFEREAMKDFQLLPVEETGIMSCSFGHIFAGGYSSGYYSYKWAEVLDADAFAYFKEKGIFNSDVAKSFRENILERGGSEDPMILYKRFRGQEPDPDALLERSGLL